MVLLQLELYLLLLLQTDIISLQVVQDLLVQVLLEQIELQELLLPLQAGVNGADGSYVTVIDFPEGTGCPFEAGDAVSLSVTDGGGGDQSYYDFSHKCVASVNVTSDVNGYFGTRCIINNDYGVGYAHTALSSSNYAELRGSFMVAVIASTGTGNAYIQQVQVSGEG